MGCCYLKAEPFLFFHLVLSLLGSQSYLGCCYLMAKPFLVFYLVLSLLGSCFILDCAFSSYGKLILSMNRDIIKFTYLDFFLCRFNWTLTAKSRDEKAMFVLIKKIVFLLRWPTNLNLITYHKCTFRWRSHKASFVSVCLLMINDWRWSFNWKKNNEFRNKITNE